MNAKSTIVIFSFFAVIVLFSGCVSPSEQFYTPVFTAPKYDGPVEWRRASGKEEGMSTARQLLRDGYVAVGYSSFHGGHIPTAEEVKRQAKKVNANYVIYWSEYMGTINGVNNVTIQNPDRTITSDTMGTIYGNGGTQFYRGETTTTVPGGYSQYAVPYSVNIYSTEEGYFAKPPKPVSSIQSPAAPHEMSDADVGLSVQQSVSSISKTKTTDEFGGVAIDEHPQKQEFSSTNTAVTNTARKDIFDLIQPTDFAPGSHEPPSSRKGDPLGIEVKKPLVISKSVYIGVNSSRMLDGVMDDGSVLKLDDDSLWLVSPVDAIDSSLWLPPSEITVIQGNDPQYPYKLVNTDDSETVNARLIRQ